MLDSLLSLDLSLFMQAQDMLSPTYARFVQILGESVVIWWALLLISLWLYGVKREDNRYKIDSLSIFTTIILTFLFYSIANLGLPQWRPGAMELSGATALIPHPTDNSFPSGHALFTGALLIGLWYFSRRSWLIALSIVLGIVTALSRIVGGVHYPGDILGGWIIGGLGGWLASYAAGSMWIRTHIYARLVSIAHLFRL